MSSTGIFLDFPNQYISNISNLYNTNENMSLASQTKCDNLFSDLGVRSYIFTFFSQLRTWFVFCFLSYVVIIHLLRRGGGVGIYCKFIPNWIESNRAWLNWINLSMNIITRPIQIRIKETKFGILIGELFQYTI